MNTKRMALAAAIAGAAAYGGWQIYLHIRRERIAAKARPRDLPPNTVTRDHRNVRHT